MKIRRAFSEECVVLSEIAMESKAVWGYSQEFMDACQAELTYSEDYMSRHTVYTAVARSGEIAGFYSLRALSPVCTEMDALFVRPDYMRQGVGRALIEHAVLWAYQCGYHLMMIQGDPNAAGFYQTFGATLIGYADSTRFPGRKLPLFQIALIDQVSAISASL
ncbi:Histone acetyltransferase HPA2/related acetyltransferase [Hahella chejuensis KCTC 2396]|uniref:Histone acetyltransferase HPA2/related acetyltransferase n=1 Tax=Hahella chejuensis (strain KCTC 2396) TaxID=349521 RepID=Q2S874_HAHCH|nr:GNAT family N-acetyltransferase [Hahella chejuensis]ABC33150.1 Histone acetyltransferase HPA2/related acetyltransferase [Hahella chejuensis KCTC 2396]